MTCQDCRNHAIELFPCTRYNHAEREKENVLLCIHCVPKCEYPHHMERGELFTCPEPRDHRAQFFCTAHELMVARHGLAQSADDPELAAEYRQTIAELEGRTEMRLAA